VREAAALVEAATAATAATAVAAGPGEAADDALNPEDLALVQAWRRDAQLLLAERAQRRGDGAIPVQLPARLSVSALVSLARDPAELARQVRRPMPRPPARQARRGTAFHEWLEQRYGQQRLIDDLDLFGPADASEGTGTGEGDGTGTGTGSADLSQLRARFERSQWAERWPRAVEVPFETLIGDRLIRGRIDAVFADDPEGGYDVVDWKTGRPPATPDESHAVSVQLAAYRLAWATLAGVPVAQVRAAFHYVPADVTVRPADLLDETGLTALINQIPAEAR
ncbi:MAG TPA: PD-(D/E)XK nuclease family protein, partial [Streptosporangiaceae bacterium]|nr:PD-(D/E)XK nuclease family protein [Streptosporangiaceae bacterium]